MPIDITSMQTVGPQSAPAKAYVPKFFSQKLTGRGGKTPGLLSVANNPISVHPNLRTQVKDTETRRYRYHQNATTVTHLPMAPFHEDVLGYMDELEKPDGLLKIAEASRNGKAVQLWMSMEAQAVTLEETEIPADPNTGTKKRTDRDFRATYEVTFYETHDPSDPVHRLDPSSSCSYLHAANACWRTFTSNPLQELLGTVLQSLLAASWAVDVQAWKQYLLDYDLYDAVARRSETWQTAMDACMKTLLDGISKKHRNDPRAMTSFQRQVKYLMSYDIPLEQYRTIYAAIRAVFNPSETRDICKQNLNLLLSDTMDKIEALKPNIPGFVPPANAAPPAGNFSAQQLAAIQSTEPLILVQSGAGCGKSTMVLGRIGYMMDCGVDPNSIMVLSFTNAAADHILEKNPRLKSMTIAKMIHSIYSLNFPDHELSELATLENTLDIYYPKQLGQPRGIVDDFQRLLKAIRKNEPNNCTEMNNFIESHYDEVIQILDTVHQTTLELEIIICYQRIDHLTEPADITSKYLIIDEVQDNSVFEFIYVLRYIAKHQEPLFIVGKLRLPTLNPTNCGKATHA